MSLTKPGCVLNVLFGLLLLAPTVLSAGERLVDTSKDPYGFFGGVSFGALLGSDRDMRTFFGDGNINKVSGADRAVRGSLAFHFQYRTHSGWDYFTRLGVNPKNDQVDYRSDGHKEYLQAVSWDWGLGGGYHWAWGDHFLSLGADLGPAYMSGEYERTNDPDPSLDSKFYMRGWGWACEAMASYEWMVLNKLGIGMELGYRYGAFNSLSTYAAEGHAQGAGLSDPYAYTNGTQASFDFSGPFIRLLCYVH